MPDKNTEGKKPADIQSMYLRANWGDHMRYLGQINMISNLRTGWRLALLGLRSRRDQASEVDHPFSEGQHKD